MPTRMLGSASCRRLSGCKSATVSWSLVPFSTPRDRTSTFRFSSWQYETDKQLYSLLFRLAVSQLIFDFHSGANTKVRFVQRGSENSTGMADLKKAENETRTRAHEDIFGDVDKWCDTTSLMIRDLRASNLQVFIQQRVNYHFFDQHARCRPDGGCHPAR